MRCALQSVKSGNFHHDRFKFFFKYKIKKTLFKKFWIYKIFLFLKNVEISAAEDRRVWTIAWCSRVIFKAACLNTYLKLQYVHAIPRYIVRTVIDEHQRNQTRSRGIAQDQHQPQKHRSTLDCIKTRNVLRFFHLLLSSHRILS